MKLQADHTQLVDTSSQFLDRGLPVPGMDRRERVELLRILPNVRGQLVVSLPAIAVESPDCGHERFVHTVRVEHLHQFAGSEAPALSEDASVCMRVDDHVYSPESVRYVFSRKGAKTAKVFI